MSAIAMLNATIAHVIPAQTQALRLAVESLPEKTRRRVADLSWKIMLAKGDEEAQELVVSLAELLAGGTHRSAKGSVTLTQWSNATPAIRAAVDTLGADKRRFAENIRSRMADRGLSQTALAAKLGVSQPTVAEFLTGKHKPQPPTLQKLAKALRCKPTDLWPMSKRG